MAMSSISRNPSARGAVLTLLRRLHFYIGLFVAPFIFVAALTGTIYVLTPQIENVLYADALTVQPQGEAKPLSQQINAARLYAGETVKVYAVRPAPGASDTTRVQFTDAALGPSESRSVFIDPYTLQVKGDMTVYGTSGVLPLRMWLDQLHRGLLLGDVGRNYSELAASWLWVAALGGVILWLSTRPRRKAKKLSGKLAVTRHWHVTLGLILAAGLVFFSVTGLTWSQWAGNNIDKMRGDLGWLTPQVSTVLDGTSTEEPTDPHADHKGAMDGMDMSGMTMPAMTSPSQKAATLNRPNADWDSVLNAARSAGIGATKIELRQPKAAGKAWTVTEVDRSWPSQVDAVSVNPDDFSIVDQVWFDRFPLVAKLTRWGVDAHMGLLFGLPNQLILAAFGLGLCVMIVLGYRMWWIRRPQAAESHCAKTLLAAWLEMPIAGKLITAMVALASGYALPMMGISLLAFLLIDVLRWQRQKNHHDSAQGVEVSLKTRKIRQFITAVAVVLLVILAIMTKAMIGGAIDEYAIPLAHWSVEMLLIQVFMIVVYSAVLTGLLSVPLWYWFLGEEEQSAL